MLKAHGIYFLIITIFVVLTSVFGIGCPFLYLFGVPCPTCGVSRALLSLLRLDIRGYFYYQPMALPLLVAVWLMLHIKLFHHKRIVTMFVLLTLVSNTFLYICNFL